MKAILMSGALVLSVLVTTAAADCPVCTMPVLWPPEYDLVEDFSSYAVGQTLHYEGDDGTGIGMPRWQVQRNSSILGDPGWVQVVTLGDKQAVQLTNRDLDGELDTIYACMSLGSQPILDQGTIYVRYVADGANDTVMGTNDQRAGWDYDYLETGDAGAPSYQGLFGTPGGYADQAALVELGGDEPFRARNGDAYEEAQQIPAGGMRELWIHVDVPGDRVKYFVAVAGEDPEPVLNADGGEWWDHRNTDVDSVDNLKFFIGRFPPDTWDIETNVVIDYIAADVDGHTLGSFTSSPPPPRVCDPSGDGWIDLDDFVILKINWGTTSGATCAQADMDGDGDVDLDDFAILKHYFGMPVDPMI